jgi:mRNA interferase MazF
MTAITRVKRGMVFWFNPYPQEDEKGYHSTEVNGRKFKSYVQAGHRPWVVVSCDESNTALPVCSIVPLTTADRVDIPIHVHFDYKNKKEIVLTEQIITVDSFLLREYEGVVSQEIMEKIDEALAIQLGLKPLPDKAEIVVKRAEVVPPEVPEVPAVSKIPAVAEAVHDAVEVAVRKAIKEDIAMRKNKKWSEEEKRTFILDCNRMGTEEIMQKYGFTHPRQLVQKKYIIKKMLGLS